MSTPEATPAPTKELTPEEKAAKEAAKEKKKAEKAAAKEAKAKAKAERAAANAAKNAPAAIKFTDDFGDKALIQSCTHKEQTWTSISDITGDMDGQEVTVRARIQASRKNSAKLCFVVLRKQYSNIQCVIREDPLPRDCIRWACGLPLESIVDVTGKVVKPKDPTSCTQSTAEIFISRIHLVSIGVPVMPFQYQDACGQSTIEEKDEKGNVVATKEVVVQQDTRLETRWLDMRTPANISIWTLQARVCQFFREYLTNQKFIEIHTPKIIPAASEGGASVFKLGYFGKDAFLAQSPQLYKQMALMGDLERVFEIGPVFRAENANTHRHLCEFVGLDVEMEIKEHYYEVLDVAEALFTYIFDNLHSQCSEFIERVNAQWPHTKFEHKLTAEKIEELGIGIIEGDEKRASKDVYGGLIKDRATSCLRLEYPNGVALLNTILPDDEKMDPADDLNTTNEKKLGALIKERYGVDFFILDQFPASVRPFYTMPSKKSDLFSNSYDMFMRGEEISSGAQRIHDAALLEKRGKDLDVDMSHLKDYIDSFRLGGWPHGGFGVGMERVVMLFLGLHNIRSCSMFPRDPRRNTP
eukprot:TRINITY_DN842_c1_g1_i1.p1 TRINITY_DN842_c1_g1~~TRINITY_DN842_c1_g1_i1.p1  ORF type:complete len:583 (+),score=144.43 TRINITY_DN842_c1_g1_i1:44-1792(+)